MTRQQTVMLILLLLLAVFVAVLALRTNKPPWLPEDSDHAVFTGAAVCNVCHGPDAPAPRSRNHPVGRDCMRCHGRR